MTWMVGLLIVTLAAGTARADVATDVRRLLADKYMSGLDAGIMLVSLGKAPADRRVLFTHQEDKPLIPASNLKLVTTSAALSRFGADFRYRTALLSRQTNDGIELAIVGDGDPSLGDLRLLEPVGWGIDTVFVNWARALKDAGITSATRLLVDDSIFDEQFLHPSWPSDQTIYHYVAQVAGINLNINVVFIDVRPDGGSVRWTANPATKYLNIASNASVTDKNAVWFSRDAGTNNITVRGETNGAVNGTRVTIHDPAMYAGTVLAETLDREGVRVAGGASRDRSVRTAIKSNAGGWRVVAVHETPMAPVIGRTNKDSVNMYAEALCKRLGFVATGESGSWTNGTAAMGEYVRGLGIEADQFSFDDGCGLSRKNRISAKALMRVLEDNYYAKDRSAFFASLAIGGVDGTFANRFTDNLRGRVFGKSGYINGVSALSGYVQAQDGNWYAFAILMNNVPGGTNATARGFQERIVKAVDDNGGR